MNVTPAMVKPMAITMSNSSSENPRLFLPVLDATSPDVTSLDVIRSKNLFSRRQGFPVERALSP
jgi:hypothetical protein